MVKVFDVSCIDELICEADEFDTDLEPDYQRGYDHGWNNALYALKENAPTVDAVPVVRCKDCIHYNKSLFQGKGCCRRKNYTFGGKGTSNLDVYVCYNVEDDHYCSDGERRTKDETN